MDTGQVPRSDRERTIESKQQPVMVRGARGEEGQEVYIEMRGPSGLGARSKTPYQNVLPKYKRTAEQALNKGRIPKEHQNRVREYFKSLEGGR